MKRILFFALLTIQFGFSQKEKGALQFWEHLKKHCGKSYEGTITAGGTANDAFSGKKLMMHVRSCAENQIKIPFFVGDDRSRTWILTLQNDVITLKHDHRHKDGSEDKITQYGGTSPNTGLPNIQIFPADQFTADLIHYASTNVWWITIDENSFTYNLKRIGSDRIFTVSFDLKKPITTPEAPWGWED
ncbi:hypothetical protein FLCU109888_02960 [Flavobacterium cucumis]|uniref:Secreted protein n=1 Tax=Flavobacterium cucumis TaxID=416016 RepID=A0A1M7ZUJ7_9FLAO|nr:hypothetical protein [Flavobacterium cucumis]SHO72554.1 hypothetical protein SAMN05443547_0888 [Flavobacterium cucumis]